MSENPNRKGWTAYVLTALLFAVVGFAPAQAQNGSSTAASSALPARKVAFELRYDRFAPGRVASGRVALSRIPGRQNRSQDKTLHTVVSTGLVVGTYYGTSRAAGWPQGTSLGVAVGGTLTCGLLKELWDRSQVGGRFSGMDMLFNLFGTGLGTGIVLSAE